MIDADPYLTLGVGPDATPSEIRAAFREAVRQQHPDTATVPTDDAAVRDLIDAYRLLIDPVARAGYDAKQSPTRGATRMARRSDVLTDPDRRRTRLRRAVASCADCRGIGLVRTIARCPTCNGRAEITLLDRSRSRVLRCRRCRGTGRVTLVEQCPTCGGTGVTSVYSRS
jgi:DnaJ-class molecular chaperone